MNRPLRCAFTSTNQATSRLARERLALAASRALIVPEAQARDLRGEFVELRTTWTVEREVKSHELTDEQNIAALSLIGRYDVVAMITAYDRLHHRRTS